MDCLREQWTFAEGNEVVGADGEKIGEVIAVHQTYVLVQQGLFLPVDYYIPTTAIANCDGDTITLNVTKDAALDQGWDAVPTEEVASATDTTRSP
ncbi:MAG: DUF2171 domain-containing protein [Chloroflexota bacterium]|nr:DUF2171 domain-containing protein [Chloroflexota bacterium]